MCGGITKVICSPTRFWFGYGLPRDLPRGVFSAPSPMSASREVLVGFTHSAPFALAVSILPSPQCALGSTLHYGSARCSGSQVFSQNNGAGLYPFESPLADFQSATEKTKSTESRHRRPALPGTPPNSVSRWRWPDYTMIAVYTSKRVVTYIFVINEYLG